MHSRSESRLTLASLNSATSYLSIYEGSFDKPLCGRPFHIGSWTKPIGDRLIFNMDSLQKGLSKRKCFIVVQMKFDAESLDPGCSGMACSNFPDSISTCSLGGQIRNCTASSEVHLRVVGRITTVYEISLFH